jgi:CO dehydrogenase maturation factor
VEPGRGSIETAYRIEKLAKDIGLINIALVGNKINNQAEKDFLTSSLKGFDFLGFIPYDAAIVQAEINNIPLLGASNEITAAARGIYKNLIKKNEQETK